MLFFLTITQQYALPSRSKQFSSMKYEARQISLFYVADTFFDLVMHHVEKVELLSLSMQPPLATNVWFLSLWTRKLCSFGLYTQLYKSGFFSTVIT